MANNIAHDNMLFYPLYYDIISLTSLIITRTFHLILGFAENQIIFQDFKIKKCVQITQSSENGDSDSRGSTVIYIHVIIVIAQRNTYSYFLTLLNVLLECFMASTSMDGVCIGLLYTCIMMFTVFI